MKSWKIGAIAGLIAGIAAGIVSFFEANYVLENGLPFWGVEPYSIIPLEQIAITEISSYIIWGIVLGIIYSKVYEIIPGKGFVKGFTVGLLYSFIYSIRWAMFCIMYSIPHTFFHSIIIFITLGFVLGISYELLSKKYISKKEKVVAIKHNLKGAIHPGAIAGMVAGLSSFFYTVAIMNPLLWPKLVVDIGLLMSQLGTNVLFNIIWGIIFGILFAMFYDKIPKKGILKGLIFSIIVYFFTNIPSWIRNIIYAQWYSMALWSFLAALFVFVPFAIVIGYLYKPPK